MRKLLCILIGSSLSVAVAVASGGCGGSGGTCDGGTCTEGGTGGTKGAGGTHGAGGSKGVGGSKGSGGTMGSDGGDGGTCENYPEFVLRIITKNTDNTSDEVPIPECGGWPNLSPYAPPGASDPQSPTEFSSLFP